MSAMRSRNGPRTASPLVSGISTYAHESIPVLTWHRHRGFASAAAPTTSPQSHFHSTERNGQPPFMKEVSAPENTVSDSFAGAEHFAATSMGPGLSRVDGKESIFDATSGVALAVADTPSSWSDVLLVPATSFICNLHDATGLPWWMTIALATISVRTLILPLSVYTMRNASVMAAIQDDLKDMREEIMMAMKSGNRPLAEKKQTEQRDFMKSAGVSPIRVLAGPMIQFPVFISFFVGIRRMAAANPDFTTGGIAWFVDLSSKDVTFGLPILAGLSLLAMTELGGDTGSKMTPTMRMAMRFMAVVSVPMTSWMPSAVFCYWIPNNIFSMCLGGAMRSPVLKKQLGLAVDPGSIVGTKAAARAALQKSLSAPKPMSRAHAAATYGRENISFQSNKADAAVVKPILLRTRPKVVKKSKVV